MILEGLVTTVDPAGRLNVAPMGPIVSPDMDRLVLRPFRTSQTYRNLLQRPSGVFHVVDDVLLLAKAAIGRLDQEPETFLAERVAGRVLRMACRWYEFEVESINDSQERTELSARVVHVGRLRDVFGFNRAKHAVIEAAILATRLHLISRDEIHRQYAALKVAVEKTAGPDEPEAFSLLERFVHEPPAESDRAVRVVTGARLHFGPLAAGATMGRQFGGVGMMIDSPGVTLTCRPLDDPRAADRIAAPAEVAGRVETALSRFRSTASKPVPPLGIEVTSSIPPHAGLGSGTQLGLAVARGAAEIAGVEPRDAASLATHIGRGLRSAIGLGGFDRGGLLVDGGKRTPDSPGTIVTRVDVPDWRIVLFTPGDETGLSGAAEKQAFAALPPMPRDVTDSLCRIALIDLLPAVRDADFPSASEAVFEYGKTVGEYFAPIQSGVCAHPRMRELAVRLRSEGIAGVGQTSWGPTLLALMPDAASAQSLRSRFWSDPLCTGCDIQIVRPLNRGARVEVPPPPG